MPIANSLSLGLALQKVGLLPENTGNVEIIVGVDRAMVIRFEVYVKEEDMPKLAEAFRIAAEDYGG